MHFSLKTLCVILTLTLSAIAASGQELHSPNGQFVMNFSLKDGGVPTYQLNYKGKEVIKPSKMGLELTMNPAHQGYLKNQPDEERIIKLLSSLYNNFEIVDTKTAGFDETWQPVWGETKNIRNHYNELAVTLNQ